MAATSAREQLRAAPLDDLDIFAGAPDPARVGHRGRMRTDSLSIAAACSYLGSAGVRCGSVNAGIADHHAISFFCGLARHEIAFDVGKDVLRLPFERIAIPAAAGATHIEQIAALQS
jgi:hypothetical protein